MTVHTLGIMREFKTKNFLVRAEALEEMDLELSWDDTGEIARGLQSGEFIAFTAHVEVFYKGQSVGEDYLGNCICKSFGDFMDHKECGKQNRDWQARGAEGRCGSCFSDMIHEAITEARKTLTQKKPYIRQVRR